MGQGHERWQLFGEEQIITCNVHRGDPSTPPPPCATTAAVPKNQAKQRFNAHPVLRQDHACMWHT